ncbi:MAG: ribonuclease E/G [Lachnospiraceae bacterium]|nr:ribonuclease E/G [Lachnospiraceae bacterium]
MSRKIMQFHEGIQKDSHESDKAAKVLITTYQDKEVALLIKEKRLMNLYTIENDTKVGNVYVGKVKNMVKDLEACFVEITDQEIAYLPLAETKSPILLNRKYDGRLVQGDELLVQLEKEPIKTKQASLTTKISLSSECFVFTCEEACIGVSAKLDKGIREQIKKCLHELESEADYGEVRFEVSCIVRTDGGKLFEKDSQEFIKKYKQEKQEFLDFLRKALHVTCFTCVKCNLKPYLAILRRFPTSCYSEVITDLNEAYTSLQGHCENIRYYDDDFSLSKLYGLNSKIDEAFSKKVWLPSGGYLVIEQTECLTTIDVNSGKMIKGNNKETSISKLNEEAALEAYIQIRLRNLSGIIIIDFVNMESKDEEEKLIDMMKGLAKTDPVHTSVIDITPLGLMEITRKKVYKSLKEQFV